MAFTLSPGCLCRRWASGILQAAAVSRKSREGGPTGAGHPHSRTPTAQTVREAENVREARATQPAWLCFARPPGRGSDSGRDQARW